MMDKDVIAELRKKTKRNLRLCQVVLILVTITLTLINKDYGSTALSLFCVVCCLAALSGEWLIHRLSVESDEDIREWLG